MENKFFHKIFSLSLAILILVSTSSFTIEKHFCEGFLINFSLFNNLEKCDDIPCADKCQNENITDADCCSDVIDVVEGQDVFPAKDFDDLDYNQQVFLFAFTVSFNELFTFTSVSKTRYKNYSSPFLITNKLVDHQTFLI